MEVMFHVIYHEQVVKSDIPRLTLSWKNKIKNAIEKKLTTNPEVFGKPLRQSLRGYRKLRVGDYRIVFRIEGVLVKVVLIRHRSEVYTVAEKRVAR